MREMIKQEMILWISPRKFCVSNVCVKTQDYNQNNWFYNFDFTVNILYETEQSVRINKPVGIITSFQKEINIINDMLLSENKIESETAGQIITFLGRWYFIYDFFKYNLIVLFNCK